MMSPDPFSPERFVRFFQKVEPTPAPRHLTHLGECWLWTGATTPDGYGHFRCAGFPTIDGGVVAYARAHRWAAVFWYGESVLYKLTWDHLCLRTGCVNPRHGAAISRPENTARGNVTRHEYLSGDPFEALAL